MASRWQTILGLTAGLLPAAVLVVIGIGYCIAEALREDLPAFYEHPENPRSVGGGWMQ